MPRRPRAKKICADSNSENPTRQDLVERVLSLATTNSVREIALLPGMPEAAEIYRLIAGDPELRRRFDTANAKYRTAVRDGLKQMMSRAVSLDGSFLHTALSRLRHGAKDGPTYLADDFDMSVLTDEELATVGRAFEILKVGATHD